jgi:hypothetical protein
MATPAPYPKAFVIAVEEALSQLGLKIKEWEDEHLTVTDDKEKESKVYLGNLFRRTQNHPPDDWSDMALHFLKHITAPMDDIPDDLTKCPSQLMPRIGQPIDIPQAKEKPWSEPLNDTDLCLNLVIDYPDRMAYVMERMMEASGSSSQPWIDQAMDNLTDRTPKEWVHVIDEDSGISCSTVNDSYDAARSLILDRLMPDEAEFGFFVLPLGRDHLFFMPVTTETMTKVHVLRMLGQSNIRKTPYAISDEVYWVHDGMWYHFPIEVKDEKVIVSPPEAFLHVLNLVEEGGSGEEEEDEADDL